MIYPILEEIKSKLSTISDAKSIKIGLEKGIGSKDTPFIRVVPTRFRRDNDVSTLEYQVVFGVDIKNREYEDVYRAYFDLEEKIRRALDLLDSTNSIWVETITDEDRVPNLKTGIAVFIATGMMP